MPCVFTGIDKTVENQMTSDTMLIVNEDNQESFLNFLRKEFFIKINTHYKFLSS